MGIDLQNMSESILSQIAFVVMLVMAFRAIAAYVRQDWGALLGGLAMGIICLIITLFGPQLQDLAERIGGAIFGTVSLPQVALMIKGGL